MRSIVTLAVVIGTLIPSAAIGQEEVFSSSDLFRSRSEIPTLSPPSPLEGLSLERKSVGLAVLYSLLLPGMGELYVGNYGWGKYFTITEGTLWLTYASIEFYGNWLREDARNFAVTYAGIEPHGKDTRYFVDIGNFLNVHDFNEKKLRDRDPGKLYEVITHGWQWQSEAHRSRYRHLRVSHDRVFNNNNFVVAAIVVNHVVSAVNAWRIALAHNKLVEQTSAVQIHASVLGGLRSPHGIMISVSTSF